MAHSLSPSLLSPAQLAEELGVPITTLYNWRWRNLGPRSLKVGRHIRYRRADIDQWLDSLGDDHDAQ
jgi:excisionase family DNA binding protein